MAVVIKNRNELYKAIRQKLEGVLKLVAKDVKSEVDEYIEEYYEEYDPASYDRTLQLMNCCKIGDLTTVNGKVSIPVYLDVESLHYTAKGAVPYKTVAAADSGLHGGFDIETMRQIPWDYVKGNIGQQIGSGTRIWEDPMEELINNGKLESIFMDCAKKRGLTLVKI